MIQYSDILYNEKNKLDLYLPENKGFTVILHFHGGGMTSGDKSDTSQREMAIDFAKNGYGYSEVNYSMYPDAKFPEYLTDCAEAIKFVKDNAVKWGGNGEIIVSGQSAGAWLTLMLCFNGEYLKKVGLKNSDVKAWISDSAQTTGHFNVINFEKGIDGRTQTINEYAPLNYVNEKTDFNKLFLICYEKDMPCRPEQNRLLYSAIKYFNPNAKLDFMQLKGEHCHGSSVKDEDGRYEYVKVALKWLSDI